MNEDIYYIIYIYIYIVNRLCEVKLVGNLSIVEKLKWSQIMYIRIVNIYGKRESVGISDWKR